MCVSSSECLLVLWRAHVVWPYGDLCIGMQDFPGPDATKALAGLGLHLWFVCLYAFNCDLHVDRNQV